MVNAGAEILFYPGAFNMTTGPAHWELTFRARALDNQVYCVGVAPALNRDASYHSYGHSIITNPWGEVITQLDEKENLKIVEIDLDEIKKAEEQIVRLEKFVKKLPLYLDFEKSVTSIQQLELDKQKIEKDLDSIATQEELLASKKEGYNKFLVADEKIEKLNNQKINLEKELATLTQLEKDKKQLLKSIEGNSCLLYTSDAADEL